MKSNRSALLGGAALGLAGLIAAGGYALNAATSGPSVAIDADDIGGVVTNPSGQPEAGVWVIAETHDLDVRYIKIVVTDDQGRFVVPDLPSANYSVWVRGYGLVDSDKVTSKPGTTLSLAAKPAPSEHAAAQYYPAAYWYSMMKLPGKDELPEKVSIDRYLNAMKNNGCVGCHQLGQLSTRTIPAARQLVNHGHVTVDGRKVDVPSFRVRTQQVVGLREKSRQLPFVVASVQAAQSFQTSWLSVNAAERSAVVVTAPDAASVPFTVAVQLVVEFYSQRV